MTLALTLTVLFVALIGYGLQRNARRQTGPKPPLSGSSDVPDRDLQRIRAELAAVSSRQPASSGDAGARAGRQRAHAGIAAQH
jgi:hypothetical protein